MTAVCSSISLFISALSKIEIPKDVRNSKSENMKSSCDSGLNIRKKCKSQMGQDQVSGGESVLCWLVASVAIFYGNIRNLILRSKSVIRSRSVISSQIGVMSNQLRVSLYITCSS